MILTFNQKEWITSINDLLVDYAKNNSIDYTLTITLKEIKK